MTKRPKIDLTPEQWVAIGAFGAFAIGVRVVQELNKSPAKKSEERRRHAERNALRREYEAKLKEAWKIDAARWRQFETDPDAQAAILSEVHISIDVERVAAEVSYDRGNNFGHVWERITAKTPDETLVVVIDHDGGRM